MEFSTDNQKIRIAILSFLAGVILAFVVFPRHEQETVYKFETKVESDLCAKNQDQNGSFKGYYPFGF